MSTHLELGLGWALSPLRPSCFKLSFQGLCIPPTEPFCNLLEELPLCRIVHAVERNSLLKLVSEFN